MLQEQSLTPDLMAFVACCIPASSVHPHKAKLARTSCLLCRPSTLTPHATWQKKMISTQFFSDRKSISNWQLTEVQPILSILIENKKTSNSSQFRHSSGDLQIILLTCCQAVVKPQAIHNSHLLMENTTDVPF